MRYTLIPLLIFTFLNCNAQIKKDSVTQIKLELIIKLNDSIRENQNYEILIRDLNSGYSDKFVVNSKPFFGLNYECLFEIEFTCNGCSTVVIDVDTYNAHLDNWVLLADILLTTSNREKRKTGKIFYSEKQKNFTRMKY